MKERLIEIACVSIGIFAMMIMLMWLLGQRIKNVKP